MEFWCVYAALLSEPSDINKTWLMQVSGGNSSVPKITVRNRELFFLFLNQKICCVYPKNVFKHPKHVFKFTLKLLKWPNLRAISYASLLILTHKLHCTSKGDALKWPVLKKKHFK